MAKGNRTIIMGDGNFNERIEGDYLQQTVIKNDGEGVEVTTVRASKKSDNDKTNNVGIGIMSGGSIGGNTTIAGQTNSQITVGNGNIQVSNNTMRGQGNNISISSMASNIAKVVDKATRATSEYFDLNSEVKKEAGDNEIIDTGCYVVSCIEKAYSNISGGVRRELNKREALYCAQQVLGWLETVEDGKHARIIINNKRLVRIYLRGRIGNSHNNIIQTILDNLEE